MSIDIAEEFKKYDDEDLEFEAIDNKRSSRPDLHAFILLNELLPATRDMVSCAGHDQIWLDVDMEALAKVATAGHIRELAACGVWLDEGVDSLSMFV